MTTLDVSAPEFNVKLSRGDTFAFTITFRDAESTANPKAPLTLDVGDVYVIAVDRNRNPTDGSTQIFLLTGTVLAQSGSTLGQVAFQASLANWTTFDALTDAGTVKYSTDPESGDKLATVFLDVQQIDSSASNAIRSKGKGKFIVKQDINKATS